MYILIITLLVIRPWKSSALNLNPCDGKIFLDKYYDEQVLVAGVHKATNLVMDRSTEYLFFSYTARKGTHLDFSIRVCYIPKMKCRDLKEVIGGRAVAYDRKTNEVYFGGREGIYKYNYTSGTAHFFAEKGKSIWNLFVQRHLYYIESNKKKLFVFKNGKFIPVSEVGNLEIDNFFVSKRFTMYYSNKTALYKGYRPVKPAELLDNTIRVKQITQDYATDTVFFAANNGIYFNRDIEQANVTRASDIRQTFGITFKNDKSNEFEPGQLIYSNKNGIYILLPSQNSKQCTKKKSRKSFNMHEKIRKPRKI